MPFDAHKSVEDLINSSQLDELLGAARAQIQKNAAMAGIDPAADLDALDSVVEEARKTGSQAVEGLSEELESTKVSEAQKVAIVDLLVSTVSGLI